MAPLGEGCITHPLHPSGCLWLLSPERSDNQGAWPLFSLPCLPLGVRSAPHYTSKLWHGPGGRLVPLPRGLKEQWRGWAPTGWSVDGRRPSCNQQTPIASRPSQQRGCGGHSAPCSQCLECPHAWFGRQLISSPLNRPPSPQPPPSYPS